MSNEEVSRILRMLEEGKISADEAERLIRSLKDTAAESEPSEKRWKCTGTGEPADFLCRIVRAFKAGARRQRRFTWWRYYWFAQRLADARKQRRSELTIEARVRHLFTQRGLADPDDLSLETRLADLSFDDVARDVLRFSLEDEFELAVSAEQLSDLSTVGDIVGWIAGQTPEPAVTVDATASGEATPQSAPDPPIGADATSAAPA